MPLNALISPLPEATEALAHVIVESIVEVRTILGRGMLERAYREALRFELEGRGLQVDAEVVLPFDYKGHRIDRAYRLDLWVERTVVIECKVVEELRPEHYGQVATYLRLAGNRLGFLVNFDATPQRAGIKRVLR